MEKNAKFLNYPFSKAPSKSPIENKLFWKTNVPKIILKKIIGIQSPPFGFFGLENLPLKTTPNDAENESTRLRPFRDHHECSQVEGSRGKWFGVEAQRQRRWLLLDLVPRGCHNQTFGSISGGVQDAVWWQIKVY